MLNKTNIRHNLSAVFQKPLLGLIFEIENVTLNGRSKGILRFH